MRERREQNFLVSDFHGPSSYPFRNVSTVLSEAVGRSSHQTDPWNGVWLTGFVACHANLAKIGRNCK